MNGARFCEHLGPGVPVGLPDAPQGRGCMSQELLAARPTETPVGVLNTGLFIHRAGETGSQQRTHTQAREGRAPGSQAGRSGASSWEPYNLHSPDLPPPRPGLRVKGTPRGAPVKSL